MTIEPNTPESTEAQAPNQVTEEVRMLKSINALLLRIDRKMDVFNMRINFLVGVALLIALRILWIMFVG